MWFRSYRNHVIMAFPSFDTATNLWAPQANISWVVGSARKSEFVRFNKRVTTEPDAVAWAFRASQAWIDQQLRTSELGSPRETGRHASTASKSRRTVGASKSVARTLTFAQFKSLMGKSGVSASEQSLKKSYTALAQLRKDRHRSWAQIKFRMKHPRQDIAAGRATTTRRTTPRLPLTLRDWRRFI